MCHIFPVKTVRPRKTTLSLWVTPGSYRTANTIFYKQLTTQNGDLFALDPSELGVTNVVQHTINTGDCTPINQPARRIPFALRSKVDSMTEETLEQGIIQPSQSPWVSPIVLVVKKDGTTCFCVDYQRLNAIINLDVLPLPQVDDSLDLLAKSKYFSTSDLVTSYWRVCHQNW